MSSCTQFWGWFDGIGFIRKKTCTCSSQDDGKGGLGLRGGSLHHGFGGFDGFGLSGEHLALLLLVPQNTVPRDDRDGFGGFGGFGRDGYPP